MEIYKIIKNEIYSLDSVELFFTIYYKYINEKYTSEELENMYKIWFIYNIGYKNGYESCVQKLINIDKDL